MKQLMNIKGGGTKRSRKALKKTLLAILATSAGDNVKKAAVRSLSQTFGVSVSHCTLYNNPEPENTNRMDGNKVYGNTERIKEKNVT